MAHVAKLDASDRMRSRAVQKRLCQRMTFLTALPSGSGCSGPSRRPAPRGQQADRRNLPVFAEARRMPVPSSPTSSWGSKLPGGRPVPASGHAVGELQLTSRAGLAR